AVTAALSAAGVESGSWLFHGFLPPKPGARRAQLQALAALPVALVFYEAPHRIEETLADMAAVLDSARLVTLAR
ncbi:MAG: 16S rRNA (cytidine(1402)-2'-O)-methyltransferase, partial [Rhodospirillaceae bacterium]|nr:16S rRNA (cytidine(1402)-2'-O)-methyltransferase [Rhodospirillaceae bacterium]